MFQRNYQTMNREDSSVFDQNTWEKIHAYLLKQNPNQFMKELNSCITMLSKKRFGKFAYCSSIALSSLLLGGSIVAGCYMIDEKAFELSNLIDQQNLVENKWYMLAAGNSTLSCSDHYGGLDDFAKDTQNGCTRFGGHLLEDPNQVTLILLALCNDLLKEFCELNYKIFDNGFNKNGWIAFVVLVPIVILTLDVAFLIFAHCRNNKFKDLSIAEMLTSNRMQSVELNKLQNLYVKLNLSLDKNKTGDAVLRQLMAIKTYALKVFNEQRKARDSFAALEQGHAPISHFLQQAHDLTPLIYKEADLPPTKEDALKTSCLPCCK